MKAWQPLAWPMAVVWVYFFYLNCLATLFLSSRLRSSLHDMSVIYITLAIFGVVGTILNMIIFCVLFKVNIGSRMTLVHLRCQSLIDANLCFVTFLYKVIGESIRTGLPPLDAFFCVVWYRDSLIWLGVILSMLNIACVSLDRFLAVFFPVAYKLHQTRFLWFTFSYIISNSVVVFTPNLLRREYYNGNCTHDAHRHGRFVDVYLRSDAYLWLILIYVVPITFIAISHTLIIYRLAKSNRNNRGAIRMGRNTSMGRLTVSTVLMGSILVLSHSFDLITYTLSSLKLFQYQYLAPSQQLGVLFIVWSSCLLPCVLTGFNLPIQNFFKSQFILCKEKCKKHTECTDRSNESVFTLSNTKNIAQ